jgi:hypothetical protein
VKANAVHVRADNLNLSIEATALDFSACVGLNTSQFAIKLVLRFILIRFLALAAKATSRRGVLNFEAL